MTIPLLALLGFAAWTLAVLFGTIGIYRWRRILAGRASVAEWRPDVLQGDARYQRAMRAHMNCIENLPVFGAVVVVIVATGIGGRDIDALCLGYLAARVLQSLVHITFEQTERVALLRFSLYGAQAFAAIAIGVLVVLRV